MNVTALFAEILTVGVQTLCWITLALCAFGVVEFEGATWSQAADWSALLATVFLAVAYTTGVVVDRFADDVARRWFREGPADGEKPRESAAERRRRRREERAAKLREWNLTFSDVRLRVYRDAEGVLSYLEYQRSRIRIARATMLNLIPTAVFGAIAAGHVGWSPVILGAGALGFVVVRGAWLGISDTYEQRLLQAYEGLAPKASGPPGRTGRRPAGKRKTAKSSRKGGKKAQRR